MGFNWGFKGLIVWCNFPNLTKWKFMVLHFGLSVSCKYFNQLKPPGYVMFQKVWHSTTVRSAHTVFMCFVFIWERTATCATYSINWLVFITEMKSVYSAVRTGSLNKAFCASESSSCLHRVYTPAQQTDMPPYHWLRHHRRAQKKPYI